MKIRSKSFLDSWFRIISSSFTTSKLILILESLLISEEVKFVISDSNPNQSDSNLLVFFLNKKLWMARDLNLLHMDSNPSLRNSKLHYVIWIPRQQIRIQLPGIVSYRLVFEELKILTTHKSYNPSPTAINDIKGIYTPKIFKELQLMHLEK